MRSLIHLVSGEHRLCCVQYRPQSRENCVLSKRVTRISGKTHGRTQKAGQSRGGHQPWGLGATGQVPAACFSPSRSSSSARKISFFPAGLHFRGLGKDLKGYVGDDGEPTASTSCLGREPQLPLGNSMTQQPPKTGTERAMQQIGRRNCSKSNET